MRLFISEFVCGGACPDTALSPSLAREGRAMLLAIIEDASRIRGWSVSTTWDHRLGEFPLTDIDCRIVDGPQSESIAFRELASSADATYVIAPEIGDLLASRCREATDCGGNSLNAAPGALQLCSDKLRTGIQLRCLAGVPTIPAHILNPYSAENAAWPVVVKPRFGAGSHETWLVNDMRELERVRQLFPTGASTQQGIMQPYVAGRALSVAVVAGEDGSVAPWPIAEQCLSADGRFRYLGGRIPARNVSVATIQDMAVRAVRAFPGLRGYVGVDIVLPDASPDEPLVVELNPRLTTSYLGYRRLTETNLAPFVLQMAPLPDSVPWKDAHVEFEADGRVT